MPRFGIILETREGRALVSTARRGVCAECSEKASCSFENALGKTEAEQVEVFNPVNAGIGQFVEFDLPGRTELKLSVLIWAVPVAGLIAGAVLGHGFHEVFSAEPDPATFIGAVAGLFASLAPVIVYDRRSRRDPRLVPSIIRTVDPSTCPELFRDRAD